ncbi:MAG TPA: succinate dehydrogenase/fumarate reductase iron-sulfur subunit [Rhodospirillaceae bacterium]|nr:succinate dehydrogenase/fumarate reductase iron-sulfur subunit [Rhodospirillaceae bacterium]HAA92293.1 succinate dehydrogenase/fumarate reductase iron-sulfur subunit [Rhodospirillaceae bacterium]HAT35985.1 succinate dehydrogenase/fumarate reductase iron-sulfur subunit [Rhodospirillaceae bacterium]
MTVAAEAAETGDTITLEIWRGKEEGHYDTFSVPAQESQTILDVVTYIQRRIDPTLTYRFACRIGMCGSCAMMVNGAPRWTCRTHASKVVKDGKIRLNPLRNLPVIKDLATDMTEFFDKWKQAKGRFVPAPDREEDQVMEFASVEPTSRARKEADAGIECLGCGVCYAACDVVSWNKDYLGPAALNRAWTLVNDVRDADKAGHLKAVAEDAGCHLCHSHQQCTTYCPNHLNPTRAIAGLKRMSVTAALKGELK